MSIPTSFSPVDSGCRDARRRGRRLATLTAIGALAVAGCSSDANSAAGDSGTLPAIVSTTITPPSTTASTSTTSTTTTIAPTTTTSTTTTTIATTTTSIPTPDEIAATVVRVGIYQPDTKKYCQFGTATRIGDNDVYLTNYHVIDLSECADDSVIALLVEPDPGQPPAFAGYATAAAVDPILDIAVLHGSQFVGAQTQLSDVRVAELGDSDALPLLSTITLAGFPAIGGDTKSVTQGQYNGTQDDPRVAGAHWLKSTAVAGHGSSGGPAFDANGRLVGIVSALSVEQDGSLGPITLIRPINEAAGLISRAISVIGTALTTNTTLPALPSLPATPPTSTTVRPAASGTYTVRLGDTLFGIARAFHTTVDALRVVNGSTVDAIFDHQTVLLPVGAHPLLASEITTVPYSVISGDTIIAIAKRFSVTPAELLTVNNKLDTPDTLSVGQQLLIPQLG